MQNQFCIVSILHLAGYAVSVGERNNAVVYFAGAPRSGHVGQVVLFRNGVMNWTVAQRISGNQVSHSALLSMNYKLLLNVPLKYH